MKKTLWFTLPLLIVIWYFVFEYINGTGDSGFKFSKRDQETVFPTPTQVVFEVDKKPIQVSSPVPPVATAASESNILRY